MFELSGQTALYSLCASWHSQGQVGLPLPSVAE